MSNLSNQEKAVYAILADSVYWDVREYKAKNGLKDAPNWTPVPKDWKLIKEMSGSGKQGRTQNPKLEGFTARAYQKGNEIVIAYAGTHKEDFSGDWANNGALGSGAVSTQAGLAAIFYQEIKNTNPSADIKFTGHSLGGGLAGLMGILFNKQAILFDHAPFKIATIPFVDTLTNSSKTVAGIRKF